MIIVQITPKRNDEETTSGTTSPLGRAGKSAMEDLEPADINRRVNQGSVMNYAELYPCIDEGCLLHTNCAPSAWASDWHQAKADHWRHP